MWPSLPRDAFAGAGAGNQILLVVPCRDLIVVRNGATIGDPAQGEGFWGGVAKHLFEPLMDAFVDRLPGDADAAPYPPSPVIQDVVWRRPRPSCARVSQRQLADHVGGRRRAVHGLWRWTGSSRISTRC